MSNSQIYVSIDIETNGPVPGLHSMLSLGAYAVQKVNGVWLTHGEFYKTLNTLPWHSLSCNKGGADEQTMKFWENFPEAYKEATKDPEPIIDVMTAFDWWTKALREKDRVSAVAAPASFDYGFVMWYMKYVLGDLGVLEHRCLDLRTLSMAYLKREYLDSGKENLPLEKPLEHTHVAIEDAIEQAKMFMSLYNEIMK